MRKEFMRVLKQPLTIVVYLILIVGIIGFSFLYASKNMPSTDYTGARSSYVSSYDDVEEIPSLIESLEHSQESLDEDDEYYERYMALFEESILIYEYLYEHDIEFDEFARPTTLQGFQDNPIRYMQYQMEVLLTGLVFILLMLALSFVNYEHATGVYKFIYGTEESRLAIIKRKFLAYATHVGLVLFIIVFLLYVFSEGFNQPFEWLIFVWDGSVYGFTTGTYQWMILGSVVLVASFFGLSFFALALYSKNIFIALTASILFTGIFQFLFFHFDHRFFQTFAQFPAGIFTIEASLVEVIVIYIIKYAFAILLFITSLVYFKHKEMV